MNSIWVLKINCFGTIGWKGVTVEVTLVEILNVESLKGTITDKREQECIEKWKCQFFIFKSVGVDWSSKEYVLLRLRALWRLRAECLVESEGAE